MSQHYERGSNNAPILAKPQRGIQRPIRYRTEAVVNITFSLFFIPSLSRFGENLGLGLFSVVCRGTWQCEMDQLDVAIKRVRICFYPLSLTLFLPFPCPPFASFFISHIHTEHQTEPELPQLCLSFCGIRNGVPHWEGLCP